MRPVSAAVVNRIVQMSVKSLVAQAKYTESENKRKRNEAEQEAARKKRAKLEEDSRTQLRFLAPILQQQQQQAQQQTVHMQRLMQQVAQGQDQLMRGMNHYVTQATQGAARPFAIPQRQIQSQIVMQPQMMQPQMMQPQMMQPQMVQPQMMQPQMLQPQMLQPQMQLQMQPQMMQPQMQMQMPTQTQMQPQMQMMGLVQQPMMGVVQPLVGVVQQPAMQPMQQFPASTMPMSQVPQPAVAAQGSIQIIGSGQAQGAATGTLTTQTLYGVPGYLSQSGFGRS